MNGHKTIFIASKMFIIEHFNRKEHKLVNYRSQIKEIVFAKKDFNCTLILNTYVLDKENKKEI